MHTLTNFDQTDHTKTAPALCYDGADSLTGISCEFQNLGLHCNNIGVEFDNGMITIL